MAGRRAYPFQLISANNDKLHITKDELRARASGEPKLLNNTLRCPNHLSDEAKKEWKKIVKLYQKLDQDLLTDLDANALEIYCTTIVTYRKAMKKVTETAEVYISKADNNRPMKNPWLTVANQAAEILKQYSSILLLDPVARARIGAAKKKPAEITKMAAFMMKRAETN
jgi:P27 family predicted phage terminase small subunit